MKILFIHQNLPAQYRHVIKEFVREGGHEIFGLGMNEGLSIPGFNFVRHGENIKKKSTHPFLSQYEDNIQRGYSAAIALKKIKGSGFTPDIICAHPGWGEALFVKSIFPTAKLLCYQEYYYKSSGSDINFDPEYPPVSNDYQFTTELRNSTILQSLAHADFNVSPTEWQKAQFPNIFKKRIKVLHDGIDTQLVKPNAHSFIELKRLNIQLTKKNDVITFVNRNLEPYRGFHIFMRVLPDLLRSRPNTHVLIVGGDEVSYGRKLPNGQTYKQKYMDELGDQIDINRVHFVGRVPYNIFINILQISSVHVYLTYPFILSWSLLEAMSAGCAIVASSTKPVMEVIRNKKNGLLVDYFSPEALLNAVYEILDHPDKMANMRSSARQFVIENYDLHTKLLPAHLKLIKDIANNSYD